MSRSAQADQTGHEPHVGVLFHVAHRAVEQRVMARLREAGHDATLAQARLFARIDPEGTRLTVLAESAQVTKQTAGFLVDQLERAGYVERVADPTDARARLVRISDKGLEAQHLAREVEAEITEEWTRHLGRQRMIELRRTMERLREITDPYLS
jgi:DNA-binding MarR family transcriptional regulator